MTRYERLIMQYPKAHALDEAVRAALLRRVKRRVLRNWRTWVIPIFGSGVPNVPLCVLAYFQIRPIRLPAVTSIDREVLDVGLLVGAVTIFLILLAVILRLSYWMEEKVMNQAISQELAVLGKERGETLGGHLAEFTSRHEPNN